MLREPLLLKKMQEILKRYKKEEIEISNNYLRYIDENKRDIKEEEIINFLLRRKFYFVEKQINLWTRYKIVYELSHKYDLIIVVKEEQKVLKVISCYKTNKKLKEKWKKISKSLMRR